MNLYIEYNSLLIICSRHLLTVRVKREFMEVVLVIIEVLRLCKNNRDYKKC